MRKPTDSYSLFAPLGLSALTPSRAVSIPALLSEWRPCSSSDRPRPMRLQPRIVPSNSIHPSHTPSCLLLSSNISIMQKPLGGFMYYDLQVEYPLACALVVLEA